MFRLYILSPIAVGFGVSTPEQATAVGKIADGVIVESAIIKEFEKSLDIPQQALIKHVGEFIEKLILGAKGK